MAARTRLFVGGLPPDVQDAQLVQLFSRFGRVHGVEVAPPKGGDVVGTPAMRCRGFGYVELEPADAAALQRCMSLVSEMPGTPVPLRGSHIAWRVGMSCESTGSVVTSCSSHNFRQQARCLSQAQLAEQRLSDRGPAHTQSGAFEQYNGCKWRGSVLRLEVARPAYAARLSEEWSKDNAEPSHHETTEIHTISEPAHELSQPGGFVALNILRPDDSKVHRAIAVMAYPSKFGTVSAFHGQFYNFRRIQ